MLMLRVFAAHLFVLFSAYYFINFNYILLVTCTIYTIYIYISFVVQFLSYRHIYFRYI